MEDDLLRLYNQDLIRLAKETETPCRIERPDASAKAISPVCGSEVTIDLLLKDGRVIDIGYEIEACALTKCAVAVIKKAAPGKTRKEILAAAHEMAEMLEGGAPPAGDWSGLKILAPVADYKARHNAMLLPFEAIEKAFTQAEKK